jgi:hypothetical protein
MPNFLGSFVQYIPDSMPEVAAETHEGFKRGLAQAAPFTRYAMG